MAYGSAAINKLGENITSNELQSELEKLVGKEKTITYDNEDGTINVRFIDTEHYYFVENGSVSQTNAPPVIIYFSFYSKYGKFRETLYAYSGQTWQDWQESGLAEEQNAYVGFTTDEGGIAGCDNSWTQDVAFYYDTENTPIYASDVILDGGIYYAY